MGELEETDTEEINGELEEMHQSVIDGEGVVMAMDRDRRNSSWFDLVFGVVEDEEKIKRKQRVTKKRMEMIGIVALTGITVYCLWSKFGKSHPIPTLNVLQTKNGILT